jgi:hypothetical protein
MRSTYGPESVHLEFHDAQGFTPPDGEYAIVEVGGGVVGKISLYALTEGAKSYVHIGWVKSEYPFTPKNWREIFSEIKRLFPQADEACGRRVSGMRSHAPKNVCFKLCRGHDKCRVHENPVRLKTERHGPDFAQLSGTSEEEDAYAQLEAVFGTVEEVSYAAASHIGPSSSASLLKCIRSTKAKKIGYLSWIETVERQKGIARKMLTRALDKMHKEGVQEVFLVAVPDKTKISMEALSRFYRSMGFEHWNEEPDIMRAKLPWKPVKEEDVEENPPAGSVGPSGFVDDAFGKLPTDLVKDKPFEVTLMDGSILLVSRDPRERDWRVTVFVDGKPKKHFNVGTWEETVAEIEHRYWVYDLTAVKTKAPWSMNPVFRREDANALFRSVSPWEMAEILRTGVIEGRAGWFSGDHRREKIKLWFGEKLNDVIHNGEDWTRYVESSEPFTTLSEQAWRLEQIASAARKQKPKFQFATTPLDKLRYDAEDLAAKLREKRREAISKITESLEKQRAAMKVTSYIIETFDVPGGTRYTEGDSLSPGSEVGFADSVSYADASTIYLIRTKSTDIDAENAARWEVVDSVNPQDLKVEVPKIPAKSIIAIDALVQKSEPKVRAIEERATKLLGAQIKS